MDPIKRTNPLADRPIKALIFDLMGTCVDWHTSIKPVLDDALSAPNAEPFPSLGLRWRSAFFEESHARFVNGLPKEDIDETYRKTLLAVLEMNGRKLEPEKVEFCVRAWHRQTGRKSCNYGGSGLSELTLFVTSVAGCGEGLAFAQVEVRYVSRLCTSNMIAHV